MNEATVKSLLRAARAEAIRTGRSQVLTGYRLDVFVEPQPACVTPRALYRVRGRTVTFGAAAAAIVDATKEA